MSIASEVSGIPEEKLKLVLRCQEILPSSSNARYIHSTRAEQRHSCTACPSSQLDDPRDALDTWSDSFPTLVVFFGPARDSL